MVSASGLSAALQGAQLPGSFAAMAAAAGLNSGLMASSQFSPGSVEVMLIRPLITATVGLTLGVRCLLY